MITTGVGGCRDPLCPVRNRSATSGRSARTAT